MGLGRIARPLRSLPQKPLFSEDVVLPLSARRAVLAATCWVSSRCVREPQRRTVCHPTRPASASPRDMSITLRSASTVRIAGVQKRNRSIPVPLSLRSLHSISYFIIGLDRVGL
jgi:hypothetical protein